MEISCHKITEFVDLIGGIIIAVINKIQKKSLILNSDKIFN